MYSLKTPVRRLWILAAVLIACVAFAVGTVTIGIVAAQTPSPENIQVGVLIGFQGKLERHCLLMPIGTTGLDALEATGVNFSAQRGALGAAVCRIEQLGCTPPADTCFCQCQGNRCSYWAYFYQENGNWVYSRQGALQRPLVDGAVDGWLWSEETNQTPAGSLPLTTIADICGEPNSAYESGNAESAADGNGDWIGYGVFLTAAAVLGGLILWQRRTTRAQ